MNVGLACGAVFLAAAAAAPAMAQVGPMGAPVQTTVMVDPAAATPPPEQLALVDAADARGARSIATAAAVTGAAPPAQAAPVEGSLSILRPISDAEGPLTVSAGGSAWSGDFGAPTDTTISAALLSARYRLGNWRLSASLPYMRIDSAGAVFTGIDGAPVIVAPFPSTPAAKHVREGVGDLTLGAAYLLPTAPKWGFDLELIGKVKLPTGPHSLESGVSTGRADYAFGAEVSKPIGRWIPFASATYRDFGSNSQWKLRDGYAASTGVSYVFNDRIVGLVSYDFAQSASRYIGDSHEISASASARLTRTGLRLTGFASAGLSRGAADVTGGLSLSFSL